MKRLLSMLYIIAILLSFFSACNKNNAEIDEEDDKLDFHEGKVVITIAYCITFPPTKGRSASGDRLLKRFSDTEEYFNFKFDYIQDVEPSTLFLTGALSGNLQADFLYSCNKHLYDTYLINAIIPAENIVNEPDSEKWKSPANSTKNLYGGKIYGLFPNYWEISPELYGFLNLNMDKLEEYQIDDPYELIEAGEWTWDNFTDFLQNITFIDDDITWYGLKVESNAVNCLFPFILGNGGSFIKNADGRTIININSPEATETYDYIVELAEKGLLISDNNLIKQETNKSMLSSGKPQTSIEYDIAQIRYPYGPHGNKDIVSTLTNELDLWSFPIFSIYSESEIGAITEYLFEPLSDIYPNGWKDIVGDNVFYHESEFEYFITAAEQTEHIDMYIFSDSYKLYVSALTDMIIGEQTPSNAIDGIFSFIQEEINEKYNT